LEVVFVPFRTVPGTDWTHGADDLETLCTDILARWNVWVVLPEETGHDPLPRWSDEVGGFERVSALLPVQVEPDDLD